VGLSFRALVADSDPAARLARSLPQQADAYRWFRAPGRVNLMGDHTDYNDGLVLPMAIQLETVAAVRPSARAALETADDVDAGWERYAHAVEAALGTRGAAPVIVEGAVASSVPPGSGLSSSAALEVALALALADAAGFSLPPVELALACQEAEQRATGVPSGIMDQLASVCGRAGHALLIDCRSLEVTAAPIAHELGVLVIHSGLPRTLEGSEYADRRAGCERIARQLGLRSLRDATAEQVADEPLARHVVAENGRVAASAEALARGDVAQLGELFLESHASLRDDYRVSTPELDTLVDALVAAGAAGARLTGAGFGGCVVAVAERARADDVLAEAAATYATQTGREPRVWLCEAADGAGPIEPPSGTR